MRIQNSTQTAVYEKQGQVDHNATSRDFLGIVTGSDNYVAKADNASEAGEQVKTSASSSGIADPLLVYEQMKAGANRPDITPISLPSVQPALGIDFDDARFAWYIQKNEGSAVSTDKTINWAATGEHQLTEAEIAELKSKYDVTNLTPQKYYDLMADLSQMNAISSAEVVSKYVWKSPLPDFRLDDIGVVVMKCPNQSNPSGFEAFRRRPVTNLLKNLKEGMDSYAMYTSYVSKTEFRDLNSILFNSKPELFAQFQSGFGEEYERIARFYWVIEQLQ